MNLWLMPGWKLLARSFGRGGPLSVAGAVTADAVALAACWHLAYLFRMGVERWQPARAWYDDYVLAAVVCANLLGLAWAGLYRMPWRFFGFAELSRIVAVVGGVGVLGGVVVSAELSKVARSVLVLHPVFSILALCLMRMVARVVWEHAQRQVAAAPPGAMRRALLLGAGPSAQVLVQRLRGQGGWLVVAAFDDAPALQGRSVLGIPVKGRLGAVAESKLLPKVDYVIVAIPPAQEAEHARAMELAYRTSKTVVPWEPGSA
jgi:FlaA1/EpsC-like NDP-sugar epimerase